MSMNFTDIATEWWNEHVRVANIQCQWRGLLGLSLDAIIENKNRKMRKIVNEDRSRALKRSFLVNRSMVHSSNLLSTIEQKSSRFR